VPIGSAIMVTAYLNGIIGMGVVGVVVLLSGILNKCLLMESCEVDQKPKSNPSTLTKIKVRS
jgi:hypothetical protein